MTGSPPGAGSRLSAREHGFVMIEAVVAVVLIGLCVGTIVSAIVAVGHRTMAAASTASLAPAAQNILTDFRAASAYDPAQLAALAGRSVTFDVAEPGPDGGPLALHVVAQFAQPAASGAIVASVLVRNATGQSISVQSSLVPEAPAPRAVVPASTPPPDFAPPANAIGTAPGPIAL